MGGLAAGLSGLNAPLAEYSQQMRQLHQQTKIEMARQLGEQLARLDPQSAEYRDVVGHLNTTLGAQPGDPGNVGKFQKIAQFLHIHPDNTKGLQSLYSPTNQPQTTKQGPPGPAGPGQIPGVPTQVSIPPHEQEPMDIPSGFLAAMGAVPSLNGQGAPPMQQPQPSAPPAAQPALNPIEPKAQARMQGPPVAAAGAAAPSWSSPPVGVPQVPPVQNTASAIPSWITDLMHSPVMAKQQQGQLLAQPYLTNDAELQRSQQLAHAHLNMMQSPEVRAAEEDLRKRGYSEYQIPSMIGAMIGISVPPIPGIANLSMTPDKVPGSAAGIRRQYPDLAHLVDGLPDNAPVTLLLNRLHPEQSTVMQGSETGVSMIGANGETQRVGSRSGTTAPIPPGLMLPSQARPMSIGNTADGRREFTLASTLMHPELNRPTIIGGYAPGAMGTASTTSMNANGDMSTVRTRTAPAGSGSRVGGGAMVVPPVHAPGPASVTDNAAAAPLNGPQNTIEARARQAVERSFTSGKEAQMARSNNTALEHLDMLNEAYKQLKSNNIPAANSLINRLGKTLGLSGQTNFDTVAQRVGQETNSAYVSGGGGELERLESAAHFGSNMSPEQFHDNLVSTMRLMGSLQENLQGEYDRGTYGVGRLKVLTPTSIAIKKKYLGGTTTVPPVAGDAAKRLIDKYK